MKKLLLNNKENKTIFCLVNKIVNVCDMVP